MTEPLLFAPTPTFEVERQVRGELTSDLISLEVEEATDGLRTLSARLLAWGSRSGIEAERLLYLDGDILDFGRRFAVSIGPPQNRQTLFEGRISAIEANFEQAQNPEVIVFAEDKLMDLRMTRRARNYNSVTDAEIAREIAAEHGLAAEADIDGPTYDVVQQWNMSDLAFLRERAQLVQADVWWDNDTLYFKSRQRRNAPEITLVQGNHLISLRVRADLAHQRTQVQLSGYDAADRSIIAETAGREAIEAEVGERARNGAAILQRAFGERISYRVREIPLTAEEATDWARAEMLRRARGFVAVSGMTRGTPELTVGSRLTLERAGQPFDGAGYYVTRVRHTYLPDPDHGYRTHFEAERATIAEVS